MADYEISFILSMERTGPEFITGYQAGTDSFAHNEAAKYGVNLVYDLGTKGYFEPGFASVENSTSATIE